MDSLIDAFNKHYKPDLGINDILFLLCKTENGVQWDDIPGDRTDTNWKRKVITSEWPLYFLKGVRKGVFVLWLAIWTR